MVYGCACGELTKDLLNEVSKDLICPKCNSKLKSISEQVKLDHYLIIKDSESSEAIRQKIYNYLDSNKVSDATDSEMKTALGYKERSNIAPRRKELVDMSILKANGKRMCTDSNMRVTAWCIA